jgi:RNA polymerase sigma-70 factor (ECF subfamily)
MPSFLLPPSCDQVSGILRPVRLPIMEARDLVVATAEGSFASPAEEADLLLAAADEPAAFEAVYLAYHTPVYRYLRSLVRTDDEAADLAALTFERALREVHRFRRTGSAVGWLLRIARNAAIDAARRQRPTVAWQDVEARRLAATDPPLDEAVVRRERARDLQEAVRSLPAPTRDAIALRYGAGLSAREIGAVIGKSEAATQKLITRGLAALKEAHRAQD